MKTLLYTPEIFGLSIEVYFIVFIITIPTYFFLNWLFKKFIKNKNIRKITTWLTTLVMVPIIYQVVILLFIFALVYEPNKDFDKSRWLTDKQNRFQMANNIIDSKMLINKDTNEVKRLLGNPVLQTDSSRTWNYDMGMGGGGVGFLFHTLIIKFGRNKVTSVFHQKVED